MSVPEGPLTQIGYCAYLNAFDGMKATLNEKGQLSVDLSLKYTNGGIWCPPTSPHYTPITKEIIHAIADTSCYVVELDLERHIENPEEPSSRGIDQVYELLQSLSDPCHLQRINLQLTAHVSDETISLLTRFTSLKYVNLTWCKDLTIPAWNSLPSSIEVLVLQSTNIGDEGLQALARLTNLQELNINYTSVNGSGLHHIKSLKHLEKLEWHAHGNTAMEWVPSLEAFRSGFPALQILLFGANNITNDHVNCLALRQNLEELEFSTSGFTEIDEEGLKVIGRLLHLKKLDLNGSRVTDAGMEHLVHLQDLQSLNIGRTSIKRVSALMQLPNLCVVDLASCPHVATLDLEALQNMNPKLKIIIAYKPDCFSKGEAEIVYRGNRTF